MPVVCTGHHISVRRKGLRTTVGGIHDETSGAALTFPDPALVRIGTTVDGPNNQAP